MVRPRRRTTKRRIRLRTGDADRTTITPLPKSQRLQLDPAAVAEAFAEADARPGRNHLPATGVCLANRRRL